MNRTIVLLERDGYLLLFGWVFAEQAGLPLRSAPALIAAGVLADFGTSTGRLSSRSLYSPRYVETASG